jgi:Uncharacterized conserved protein
MKTHLDCIPCFQRQALEAARMTTNDEGKQEEVLRDVMGTLQKLDWHEKQLIIAKKVHKRVVEAFNDPDPYKRVKKESNDAAMELYPKLEKVIKESGNPLLTAIKLSIAGNIIDFGPASEFDVNGSIEKALQTKIDEITYSSFLKDIKNSRKILYFGDNAGEIVFDKLLLNLLSVENTKIRFVVKASPMLNDATLEDAHYVQLDKIPGIKFIEMETGENDSIIEAENADMIISKGQGNYEALSEEPGIYFLLLAKCPIIAKDLKAEVGDVIFRRS